MNRKEHLAEALGHPLGVRPWTRHSLVLVVSGLVYMGAGISMYWWDPEGPRAQAISVATDFFVLEFWATVWIGVGCVAMLSSRWPHISEKWGYSVLIGFTSGWSATYFAGAITTSGNDASNITNGIIYALVAFLWWAVTGLMNPDHTVVVEVEVPCGSE